jgi:colicin import membrane protein
MSLGRRHTPGAIFGTDEELRITMVMFGVSALLHGIVFLTLASMPGFGSDRDLAGSSIMVSLVSQPGPGGGGPVAAPEPTPVPEPPPAPEPEPAPEPVVQEAVSIPEPEPAPEPEVSIATEKPPPPVKTSLKKKTKTDKKLKVKEAPVKTAAPEPKPAPKPAERSSSVTSAIAALKNRVAADEAGGGGGSGGGPGGATLIDIYHADIAVTVQRNWAFPQQLVGASKNLKAQVIFKVLPDGQITDIEFHKKSGNRHLDDSARKAILKSTPLAPFPRGIRRRYLEVGLTFTPSGIR